MKLLKVWPSGQSIHCAVEYDGSVINSILKPELIRVIEKEFASLPMELPETWSLVGLGEKAYPILTRDFTVAEAVKFAELNKAQQLRKQAVRIHGGFREFNK